MRPLSNGHFLFTIVLKMGLLEDELSQAFFCASLFSFVENISQPCLFGVVSGCNIIYCNILFAVLILIDVN